MTIYNLLAGKIAKTSKDAMVVAGKKNSRIHPEYTSVKQAIQDFINFFFDYISFIIENCQNNSILLTCLVFIIYKEPTSD